MEDIVRDGRLYASENHQEILKASEREGQGQLMAVSTQLCRLHAECQHEHSYLIHAEALGGDAFIIPDEKTEAELRNLPPG